MARLLAALFAAALAAGCASQPVSPALFAVLPAPDGHIGAIAVDHGGERRVIDTAYGFQQLQPDGSLMPGHLTEGEVRTRFGSTLEALPAPPASFTLYFLEGSDELEAEVHERVAQRIGKFSRPKRIIWTADVPKTRSGKIMRRLLRDIAEGRELGDVTTLREPGVMKDLEQEWADKEA